MKTNVMSLTAVMPDGRIIKTGSKYVVSPLLLLAHSLGSCA